MVSALASFKEPIGYAWSAARLGSIISPAIVCLSFIQRGTTGKTEAKEYIVGLIMSVVLFQQGILMKDRTIIYTNAICSALGILYLLIFMAYCENKIDTVKQNYVMPTIVSGALIYLQFLPEGKQTEFLGQFLNFFVLIILSSFAVQVVKIVKSKDASGVPLIIVSSKLFMGLTGFLYGVAVNNLTIQKQNLIVSGVSVTLILLSKLFPGTENAGKSKTTKVN